MARECLWVFLVLEQKATIGGLNCVENRVVGEEIRRKSTRSISMRLRRLQRPLFVDARAGEASGRLRRDSEARHCRRAHERHPRAGENPISACAAVDLDLPRENIPHFDHMETITESM
jgi:hypothetical protein